MVEKIIRCSEVNHSSKFNYLLGDGFDRTIPLGMPLETIKQYVDPDLSKAHQYIVCSILHPSTSNCFASFLHEYKNEFWRALKLYTPLNIVRYFYCADYGSRV